MLHSFMLSLCDSMQINDVKSESPSLKKRHNNIKNINWWFTLDNIKIFKNNIPSIFFCLKWLSENNIDIVENKFRPEHIVQICPK